MGGRVGAVGGVDVAAVVHVVEAFIGDRFVVRARFFACSAVFAVKRRLRFRDFRDFRVFVAFVVTCCLACVARNRA